MRAHVPLLCVMLLLRMAAWGYCAPSANEYEVKLAYLYNFCNYVTWPADVDTEEIVIGVLGDRLSSEQLKKLDGRTLGENKRISARRIAVDDLKRPMHMLFVVGDDEAAKTLLATAAKQLENRPVLIVAEHPDAATVATVRFVWVRETIKFSVDRSDAAQRKLDLNAKLLRLAVPQTERITSSSR